MGFARSTFYDKSGVPLGDDELVTRIGAICDEFECYGYRRVGAALRHQSVVVNGRKLRRLMREHELQPKRRRRYVVTTDSDHAGPIYPDLAKELVPERPNQLWVADLTYVAIPGSFVYLAAILDAWSRKVVGYSISRSMDARIAVAALKAAIRNRAPPRGCTHHSDRGSQYASEMYRELLASHGLTGSMSCRGNPYDNAKAESFMKTLKVEAVYLAAYETFEDVTADLPRAMLPRLLPHTASAGATPPGGSPRLCGPPRRPLIPRPTATRSGHVGCVSGGDSDPRQSKPNVPDQYHQPQRKLPEPSAQSARNS